MEKIVDLVKEYPEIIKQWQEINLAIDRIRASYTNNSIDELRKQLSPNIELGLPELFKDRIDIYFCDSKHAVQLENAVNVRFLVQWVIGEQILRVGAWLQVDEKLRLNVWARKLEQFSIVTERLKSDLGQFPLCMQPSAWWPLGAVELLSGFINNDFLAEHTCRHCPPLVEQIQPVAAQIAAYLIAAKHYIQESIAGAERK